MAVLSDRFQVIDFADLPGWGDDELEGAFAAFRRSAYRVAEKPYRTGSLGVEAQGFDTAFAAARESGSCSGASARNFFETHFLPAKVRPQPQEHGFVTGFYEPILEASPIRTDRFRVPLLRRPDDLVEIDDTNRPPGFDPGLAFGRRTQSGVVEYFDRGEIERGALADRDLALAWVEHAVDAYFVHVQGAARLLMPDGSQKRITYAAKSGHAFTGAGRVLVDLGELALADVTMQSIRAWLKENPRRTDEILWRNRSYIFFREAPVSDPDLGPVAAAKVPLAAGRSVAVDRLLHTFATPLFIGAPSLTAFDGRPFRRLMIAQDTGSAIVGPARGDLFAGSGDAAGAVAGVIRHPADFYALLPRPLLGKALR
jgi:membrane-bound lytic murein transglycosylase A